MGKQARDLWGRAARCPVWAAPHLASQRRLRLRRSGAHCLSAIRARWRSSPRGQTFEGPPTGVRDPNASNLDPRVVALRGLKPYSCEFASDEIRNRLKLEPEAKQIIHTAALGRHCQDFEHLAMSLGESLFFGFRGHFDSHHGVDDLPRRAVAGVIAESFASKHRIADARLQNRSGRVIYVKHGEHVRADTARPADAECLGDGRGPEALRLKFA